VRERIHHVFAHYHFEEYTFDQYYKKKIYRKDGLLLWERRVGDKHFSISLTLSPRCAPEGELSICLMFCGNILHCLSFNWMDGNIVNSTQPVIPIIGRNQGISPERKSEIAAFEEVFPNNSPRFFCFAAMQGIAGAVKSPYVLAVKAHANICFNSVGNTFCNAYDRFWESIGGMEISGEMYLIALPFYTKPLIKIPSKHRKRTSMRRLIWSEISSSAQETLQLHIMRKDSVLQTP
jgi:uncharacterized protein VirK/YbjX